MEEFEEHSTNFHSKLFKCPICNLKFKSLWSQKHHSEKHLHSDSLVGQLDNLKFRCTYQIHQETTLKIETKEDVAKLGLEPCDRLFTTAKKLDAHYQ